MSGGSLGTVVSFLLIGALMGGCAADEEGAGATGETQVAAPSAQSPSQPGSTSPPTATPTIGLSPTSLSFTGQAGGANPSSQAVTVTDTAGGSVAWAVSDDQSWLSATQSGSTVRTNVNLAGLSVGLYSGSITVSASGATNSPQTVPVTLTVAAAPVPPAIGLSPTALTFTATEGGSNPGSQILTVSNTGGGSLSWTVSDNRSWLSVAQSGDTVTANVTVGSRQAGTYNGAITVSASGANNSPQAIPVTLVVQAAPAPPAPSPPPPSPPPTTSSATLSWNPVTPATSAGGYNVYFGTASRNYGAPVVVGTATTTTLELPIGATYYFAVTSFNAVGESAFSNEVSKTIQ